MAIDPVCKMEVDPTTAAKMEYAGKVYYFCSEACRKAFSAEPQRYAGGAPPGGHGGSGSHHHGHSYDRE